MSVAEVEVRNSGAVDGVVLAWRLEGLLRAGYRPEQASKLARCQVDLHLAVDLVRRGCPHELACRILV